VEVFAPGKNNEHTRKKADWVFDPKSGNSENSLGLIVGLKVQPLKKEAHTFVKSVKADVTKLKLEMKPDFAKFEMAAIAVVWDDHWPDLLTGAGIPRASELKLDDGTMIMVHAWEEGAKGKTAGARARSGKYSQARK
jgi:hypothetical protein